MLNGLTQEHTFCSSLVSAYITVPFAPTELYYNMCHFFQNTAEIRPWNGMWLLPTVSFVICINNYFALQLVVFGDQCSIWS